MGVFPVERSCFKSLFETFHKRVSFFLESKGSDSFIVLLASLLDELLRFQEIFNVMLGKIKECLSWVFLHLLDML